ncbi:glycosyltransferase family 2 protein [Microbacterium sp. dk485]|uniref:glycosyltransferase family A protein n=1 Tax=Microbacterium sp. dk485 TaxID=2560021 RepID=UPI001073F71F|nr:glycosyltransferase family 2 protein [Microbacterium sp. dk485]TFV82520.1 glycosyltransferase family 2 protein [Microbacterium sp. dk485]
MSVFPRIAVVIPCRNDAPYLEECLQALAAQTRRPDEVIVVDNVSTDDSADVARRHGARVITEPLVGIWPAAARGYDEARGFDLIARLDADSRPHRDWVARIAQAFAADPDLGVLTGGSEFYGATPLVRYLGDHWYIGGGTFWVKQWLGVPLVFGSNFAMRSRVWERVRDQVERTNPIIHDDLDLTIHLRPSDGVRYDPDLRMPVSARPFARPSALLRRVWRVVPTFAASWPEGSPWHRAHEAQSARPLRAGDITWPRDDAPAPGNRR